MGKGQRLEEELDGHLRSLSPMEDDTNGKKKALPVNKDRFISKMFLGEDSVIIVLRNPNSQPIWSGIKILSHNIFLHGVSGTSLEASKMKEKGVVDATILIWSGVGGTSFEASKMKEKGGYLPFLTFHLLPSGLSSDLVP
ncbi:Phenylalanine ammonia-lyase [Musa troglodytarum]|uniref:Small nuclear ribonucleoprotein Sm D2 n=1 Tax=Musa troglodytarum TaxID=320322 RepID=A0A9E7G9D7_9LILI|nr:Phenylalanine ammonia-lyase [Musa troglodytarum]